MQHQAVQYFIRSLAHRETVETAASVLSHGGTTSITYAEPLAWPWPQQFNYSTEFFCVGYGAVSVREVQEMAGSDGNHVVNLFAVDPEPESAPFLEVGYTKAWVSPLLGRALTAEWTRPTPEGVGIHEVKDAKDMDSYSSIEGISNLGAARDAAIHNFLLLAAPALLPRGS